MEENYNNRFIIPYEMSSSNSDKILDEVYEAVYEGVCEERLNISKRDPIINVREEQEIEFESVNHSEIMSHAEDVLKNESPNGMHVMKIIKKDCKTVKVWTCGVCSKEFKHQYTLLRHLPTHTDERKFKCADCGKAFRQKSTLSQHQVIHSDARPYVCGFCKKTFNRVSTLKSHQVTHSDKKPHKCSTCGKGFHQKGNLRNHIFTHTEERPYKCSICGKGFNQKSNLMSHKQHSHRNITPFLCPICNREFPRKYVLRAHEEYVHGVQYRGGMYIHGKKTLKNNEIILEYLKDNESNNSKENKKEIHVIRVLKTREIDPSDINNSLPSNDAHSKQYVDPEKEEKVSTVCPSIIIDPIYSKAMLSAKRCGQTPIVLLKTAKGESVLVKVKDAANNKQMLVPATAQDLKSSGTISSFASFTTAFSNIKKINAIHIKVPIVATMIQRLSSNGQLSIEAEVPSENHSNDLETLNYLKQNKCYDLFNKLYPSANDLSHNGILTCDFPFDKTKGCETNNTLFESSTQDGYDIEESSFTGVTDSALSKSFSQFIISEDVSSVETVPSIDQGVQSGLHNSDTQNMHQFICVQIENEEREPFQCNSIISSNTLHTPNSVICDSNIPHIVEYDTNQDGNQFVISASNKIMLVEYDTDNSLQHIVYAKPEEVLHNSQESAQCVIIDPVHLVIQEKK